MYMSILVAKNLRHGSYLQNHMSVYILVANNMHHGSYPQNIVLGDAGGLADNNQGAKSLKLAASSPGTC